MSNIFSSVPFFIASIADKIPTKAIIPILIMSMVITALKRFALIELRAMDMFSFKNAKVYKNTYFMRVQLKIICELLIKLLNGRNEVCFLFISYFIKIAFLIYYFLY